MSEDKTRVIVTTLGAALMIILCLSLIVNLHQQTNQRLAEEAARAESIRLQESIEQVKKEEAEKYATDPRNRSSQRAEVNVNQDNLQKLTQLMSEYDPKDEKQISRIKDFVQQNFQDQLLATQDEIVKILDYYQLDYEDTGYLFLPKYPADYVEVEGLEQINVPLIIQKDVRWRHEHYGDSNTEELGENGCAIASLAMVHGTYHKNITPYDILDWSSDRYFVANQGTSWQIFYDFANHFGYQFHNFGDDFYSAMDAVNEGKVVVASLEKGTFTEVGHFVVVRGYQDGKVYVNDSNDDASKMFSIQGIPETIFLNEGLNYWSFHR